MTEGPWKPRHSHARRTRERGNAGRVAFVWMRSDFGPLLEALEEAVELIIVGDIGSGSTCSGPLRRVR